MPCQCRLCAYVGSSKRPYSLRAGAEGVSYNQNSGLKLRLKPGLCSGKRRAEVAELEIVSLLVLHESFWPLLRADLAHILTFKVTNLEWDRR